MNINQLEAGDSERFRSCQSLHYSLPSGQIVVVLAGLVNVDLQAPGWSNENSAPSLFHMPLELTLALPRELAPPGQRFEIEQAVPSLSLAAVEGASHVSWAIHDFGLSSPATVQDSLTLTAQLAVSKTGEILRRVSYHITLVGRLLA